MSESLAKTYYQAVRKKLVLHIREKSHGTNRITPRTFYKEIIPLFGVTFQGMALEMFNDMTETIVDKRWIYCQLKKEWIDYDKNSTR